MDRLKVGVVGYGTIGKRVADAVSKQDDLVLAGVVKTKPDYSAHLALSRGISVYAADERSRAEFEKEGVQADGLLDDLVKQVDVVVDCTPEGTGAKNKHVYERLGKHAIFQGGEKSEISQASFVAEVNYEEALGKMFVRVVSCNTTGLSRTLYRVHREFGIRKARAVIIRRGADPAEVKKGPINALIPNPAKFPSHHGPDVQTVIHDLPIVTGAVIAPTTLMHVHVVSAELTGGATKDAVLEAFHKSKRIRVVEAGKGVDSTASIIELSRDMGRIRGDMPEVVVWRESVSVLDNEVYYMQAVHQESIVVPENIDAVRATSSLVKEGASSIAMTNSALGLI